MQVLQKVIGGFVGAMFLAVSGPASAIVINVQADNTVNVGNCFPFGCSNRFGNFMGFIYQNIPAFALNPGDTLAFDVAEPNVAMTFNIALAATTANGSTFEDANGYTTVVGGGTPSNPTGDNTIGNFELGFTATDSFNFAGGGLVIRFESLFVDTNGNQFNLVGTDNPLDSSGFFVSRFFDSPSGLVADGRQDSANLANFRITTSTAVPEPAPFALLGAGLFGIACAWRRRRSS